MAGEGAGIAETEVDVDVAVDIGEDGAARLLEVDRIGALPLRHPAHRHAAQKDAFRVGEQRSRLCMGLDEQPALTLDQRAEKLAVDM